MTAEPPPAGIGLGGTAAFGRGAGGIHPGPVGYEPAAMHRDPRHANYGGFSSPVIGLATGPPHPVPHQA